jgi:hypothetical protein
MLCLLAACGNGQEPANGPSKPAALEDETIGLEDPPAASATPAAPLTGKAALDALHANVEQTAARPEHTDHVVELAHILVSFTGAPRIKVENRTLEQAEQRAAELLARVQAGEDFDAVRVANSDDKGASYTLSNNDAPGTSGRGEMVKSFGDVGWRLAVGEIGVAPHDAKKSPFGWHIIKRVK